MVCLLAWGPWNLRKELSASCRVDTACCSSGPGWLPLPSPAGPLWQLRTMDARVRGHNCGLCAFFPEAPAGGRWEGVGACMMGTWR